MIQVCYTSYQAINWFWSWPVWDEYNPAPCRFCINSWGFCCAIWICYILGLYGLYWIVLSYSEDVMLVPGYRNGVCPPFLKFWVIHFAWYVLVGGHGMQFKCTTCVFYVASVCFIYAHKFFWIGHLWTCLLAAFSVHLIIELGYCVCIICCMAKLVYCLGYIFFLQNVIRVG